MHADGFIQRLARTAQAQRLDTAAGKPGDGARLIRHVVLDQRDFGRFRVVAKQLNVDIRKPRGGAMPDSATQVGAKGGHALHPHQRQLAQCGQFDGLRVSAKHRDVFAHRVLQLVVVGQAGARRQGHLLDRAALGRAVFKTLFNHHGSSSGGNFSFKRLQGNGISAQRSCALIFVKADAFCRPCIEFRPLPPP